MRDLMNIIRELEVKDSYGRLSVITKLLNNEGIRYSMTPEDFFVPELRKSVKVRNIVIQSNKRRIIGIGSHFDVVDGSPGADDNGSAVAVAINLLRSLKENPLKNLGVSFFFFDLEEQHLLGSKSYVSKLSKNNLLAFYNMEMVGVGNELAFWDVSEESEALLSLEEQAKRMGLKYHCISEVLMHSADHMTFRPILGQNALTITTISPEDNLAYSRFKEQSAGKTPSEKRIIWRELILKTSQKFRHYHQPTDSSKNLNPQSLQMVSDLLYNTITALDRKS